MDGTIRSASAWSGKSTARECGDHTVIHGPMHSAPLRDVQLFFTDPPGLSPDTSFAETRDFFIETFEAMERMRHRNCALFLLSRDGKGHPFQKSIVSAYVAQEMGWHVFRQFTWLASERDYHCRRYAAQAAWAFHKGNIMANNDSPFRYKDVIRADDDFKANAHGMVQALPLTLIVPLLQLYAKPRMLVCDPFAGSGTVMDAAALLNLRSASIEIDRDRALALVRKAEDYRVQSLATVT